MAERGGGGGGGGPATGWKLFVGGLPREVKEKELWDVFSTYGEVLDVHDALRPSGRTGLRAAFVTYLDIEDAEDAVDALDGKYKFRYSSEGPIHVHFARSEINDLLELRGELHGELLGDGASSTARGDELALPARPPPPPLPPAHQPRRRKVVRLRARQTLSSGEEVVLKGYKLYCYGLQPDVTEVDLDEVFGHYGAVRATKLLSRKVATTGLASAFIFYERQSDAEGAIAALDGVYKFRTWAKRPIKVHWALSKKGALGESDVGGVDDGQARFRARDKAARARALRGPGPFAARNRSRLVSGGAGDAGSAGAGEARRPKASGERGKRTWQESAWSGGGGSSSSTVLAVSGGGGDRSLGAASSRGGRPVAKRFKVDDDVPCESPDCLYLAHSSGEIGRRCCGMCWETKGWSHGEGCERRASSSVSWRRPESSALAVAPSRGDEAPGGPRLAKTKLHVSNLPRGVTQENVQEVMETYGFVRDVFLLSSKPKHGRNAALVRFRTKAEADTAISCLNERYEFVPGSGPILVQHARQT